MKEEWKDVVGHEGEYRVSSYGRVESLERDIVDTLGRTQHVNHCIKKDHYNNGYKRVSFTNEAMAVHRLVLDAFVGPRPEDMECRHLDGDASNNHLDNLEWGTSQENSDDAASHGTAGAGEKNSMAKLTKEKVIAIRTLYEKTQATQQEIADLFDICVGHTSQVINGKLWSHIK